jgi:hypothetical protein
MKGDHKCLFYTNLPGIIVVKFSVVQIPKQSEERIKYDAK